MLPLQPNESLIDGLECLQFLAVRGKSVGVRELARQLNLEPTRVHRLLKTLAHLGIASQTSDKKYIPGPGMHVLAAQSIFASGLIGKALPHLELLQRYGMVVALGVLWKDQVSYLYHAMPGMTMENALGRIGLYPATRSSIGMALLAHHSDKEIKRLYRNKNIPYYPQGIGKLLEDIHRIRKKGFAKLTTGKNVTTMAVTVGNPLHSAIAFSGKINSSEIDRYFKILKETAEKIEKNEEIK